MSTTIEQVMRSLEAINNDAATDFDRRILKAVGGTAFRGGRFELALNMREVGRKLKRAPGIVEHRIESGMAINKAELDGHTIKDEEERPTRISPPKLPGFLSLRRSYKQKIRKTSQ